MTDVMREMIAQLMGASREAEEGRKLPPYYSRQVCRLYLIGCCPKDKLTDTRLEPFITCRRMHEPAHKADYERAQEKQDHFYDVEAYDDVGETIRVIDGEVEKIKEKVERDAAGQQDSQDFMKAQRITDLTEKINQTLAKVEELGNDGKVDESMELAKNVEDMKKRKREMESELRATNPTQQRLRVCEECGAQLNILDHESRLADHYGGRMHNGMVDIRTWYKELTAIIETRREAKRKAEQEGNGGPSDKRSPRRSPRRSPSRRSRSPDRGRYRRDDRRDRSRYRDDRRDDRRDRRRDDRDRRDRSRDRDRDSERHHKR